MEKKIGIYIHVPFCESKCPYCDFYSIKNNEDLKNSYVEKVCLELERWQKKLSCTANTLYLGGGTPGLLRDEQIYKIVSTAKYLFDLSNAEITMEITPARRKIADFSGLIDVGINRLSIGVQSGVDEELSELGRGFSVGCARESVTSAQKAGFNNISVDLMLGIPKQTTQSLLESINFCVGLNVQHISSYLLKIEEGTLFFKNKDKLELPNEKLEEDIYMTLCRELERRHFNQYEISSFAQEGFESKHNLKYWNLDEYLGIGPSAHSFIDGKRFYYKRSLREYMKNALEIQDGRGGSIQEYIMLKLRLAKGLLNVEYKEKFGTDIPLDYLKRAEKLPYVVVNNGIRITRQGFLISNALIGKILF